MTIREIITHLRIAKGLSQKKLSYELNFSKNYIAKVEDGTIIPTEEKLDLILTKLGVAKEITTLMKLKRDHVSDQKIETFDLVYPLLLDILFTYKDVAPSNPKPEDKLALVMKGGGIKGIAYIGALEELTKHYSFNWFVGTSAGAITAILLGAGYSHEEIKTILENKNFNDFKDANFIKAIYNLFAHGGLYKADKFTNWLSRLLADKLESATDILLSDLSYHTIIYASRKSKKAVVFDSKIGDKKDFSAAFSARCSMSIPFIFVPQKEQDFNIYDGGVQNNYPIDVLFEDYPEANFIGLYIGNPTYDRESENKSLLSDMFSIWTESNDNENLKTYKDKTIIIDTKPISTLNFKISKSEKEFLLYSGKYSAMKFLKNRGKLQINNNELEKMRLELEKKRTFIKNQRKNKKYFKRGILAFSIILIITYKYFLKILLLLSVFFHNGLVIYF